MTPKKPPCCDKTPRNGCCHLPAENSARTSRIAGISSSIRSSRRTFSSSKYCTAQAVKLQATTSKLQRSSKPQTSNSSPPEIWCLELGVWNFSGAWSLGFGASGPPLFSLQRSLEGERGFFHVDERAKFVDVGVTVAVKRVEGVKVQ